MQIDIVVVASSYSGYSQYLNIFSFDGKIAELDENSNLTYLGSKWVINELREDISLEKLRLSQVNEFIGYMQDNNITSTTSGFLVSHDFEGYFSPGMNSNEIILGLNLLAKKAMEQLFVLCESKDRENIIDKITSIFDQFDMEKDDQFKEFELLMLKAYHLFFLGKLDQSLQTLDIAETKYDSFPARIQDRINRARIKRLNNDPIHTPDRGFLQYDYGFIYFWRGIIHQRKQELNKAVANYNFVIEIWKKDSLEHHFDLMNVNNNLAAILKWSRTFSPKEEEFYENALYHSRFINKTNEIRILINMSLMYRRIMKFDMAIQHINRAYGIMREIKDISDLELINFYNTMGLIFQNRDLEKSTKFFEKAYNIADNKIGDAYITLTLFHLILNYLNNQNSEKCKYYFSKLSDYKSTEDEIIQNRIKILKAILNLEEIDTAQNDGIEVLIDILLDDNVEIEIKVIAILFLLKYHSKIELSKKKLNKVYIIKYMLEIIENWGISSLKRLIENKNEITINVDEIGYLIKYQIPLAELSF